MTDAELHAPLVDVPGGRAAFNTPVLIVDRNALDRNIERMAAFARAHGIVLRPHAKTHKSPNIAQRQIAAGAVGICCAKLGEAEVLADAGIKGLHITSPVVSARAIARLMALNARARGLMCVVDHPANVAALAAANTGGKPLQVIIDIDPGIRRTGVASGEAAVALFQAIRAAPKLAYSGVQYYCGMQQHIAAFADRTAAMAERGAYLRAVIEALKSAGGPPGIVTGGGTGTHVIDVTLGLFTELQVGSYVFMDAQYLDCDLTPGEAPFETALMVDARVVSASHAGMATIDAGLKAFATDAGVPRILGGAPAGAKYFFMGDEHGAVLVPEGEVPGLGAVVTLGAPHCDPTVDRYDWYHVVEGDTLRAIWPVAARGRSR